MDERRGRTMKRLALLGSCIAIAAALLWRAERSQPVSAQPPAEQAQGAGQTPTAPPARGGQPGRGRGGAGRGARQRKVVLAWADTRNGIAQHDSVSHALAVMERLGYESGLYDMFIRTDSNIISKHPLMTDGKPASGGPSLATADAIFFMGHREIQLDNQQKADLLKFVHDDGK